MKQNKYELKRNETDTRLSDIMEYIMELASLILFNSAQNDFTWKQASNNDSKKSQIFMNVEFLSY